VFIHLLLVTLFIVFYIYLFIIAKSISEIVVVSVSLIFVIIPIALLLKSISGYFTGNAAIITTDNELIDNVNDVKYKWSEISKVSLYSYNLYCFVKISLYRETTPQKNIVAWLVAIIKHYFTKHTHTINISATNVPNEIVFEEIKKMINRNNKISIS
jgi:hypothetical protein